MYFTLPQTPEKLTATEQSIIEYIASHRDEFLFMTIGQLSDALTVSEATISRFARHVGCCDFKHLKRVIMEQTVQKGAARKLANTLQAESDDFLTFCLEQQQYNLKKTLELLDRSEFDNAVEAIHTARRVFIYVKNASRAPAQLLEFRLRRIGIDVQKIPSGGSELLEWLAQMGEGDLVILFGFSKVSSEGRVILDYEKQAGYKTLLFTGRAYQDEEQRADINLLVYRGEENEFHSMTAPVAVVDALVLALSAQMGSDAVNRLERVRSLKAQYSSKL